MSCATADGAFKVLEDNLRTPSGIAYAVATREVLAAHLPMPEGLRVRSLDDAFAALGRALRATAPQSAGEQPLVVLLRTARATRPTTSTPRSRARCSCRSCTPSSCRVKGDRLYARLPDGQRAVDVVYRRTDEDRLHDDAGRLTEVARLLLEPVLAGTLACVNAFGTGVADDKLLHAYVEQMVRYYLGEQPLLRSVPTYDPAQPETLEMILDRIDELVIKPRSGHGGYGVVIAPHARREDVRKAADELAADPEAFVAQETVMLSRHPTVVDGHPAAAPRRPAAVCDLRRRAGACRARRSHARRLRRGRAGRQLLAERRQQGHLGARVMSRPVSV